MNKNYSIMSEKIDVAAAVTIDSVRVGKVLEGSLIEFSDNFGRLSRIFERLEKSIHFFLIGVGISIVIVSTSRAVSILRRSHKKDNSDATSKQNQADS